MLYSVVFAAASVALVAANDDYSESDEPTICYGDDECRGRQVCDMGSYICVDPTPSPVWTTESPTSPPGCCYNPDSYKGNDRCSGATDKDRCEDMGCTFLETDDPNDCVMTTTTEPTTTEELGCCYGEGVKENEMCGNKVGRDQCERSGNCEFRSGADADCEYVQTTTTEEPGCCAGATMKSNEMCSVKVGRDACERSGKCEFRAGEDADCTMTTTPAPTEPEGCCYGDSYKANGKCARAATESKCLDMGCQFMVTDDPTDCEMTTTSAPTTTEEVGCCKGDSMKTNTMCNSRPSRSQCERSSSCSFIVGGVLEEGDCDFGTTEPPEEPGCCYINPDTAYSKRYQTMCTGFSTERECLQQTDGNGVSRCVFEPMNEYMDCSMLWPTTTTTTEEAGCCYSGDSYKANDRCLRALDRERCEDMGCSFLVTDDPTDCEMTTTETPTTTQEQGCCKADSKKREDMCLARDTREKCEKSSSCIEWISGPDADCSFEATTTEEPGCCYINPDQAYSKKYQDTCITFQTERECLMLTDSNGVSRCTFEPMNEYMDCSMVWPTTTTTTPEPGCCKGTSFRNQAKCLGFDNRDDCERRAPGCEFVSGGIAEVDCVITTTETPTTTATPGCCAHTSLRANDKCNDIEDMDQCNRRASCYFIPFGVIDLQCILEPDTTPTPEEPGCCYGNPDIAYSKRWMESCKAFGFEAECLMLKNDDGEPRCTFEPLGEYEDCETVWPTTTTTTEEVGCCYSSDSYKANDRCSRATDRARCEAMECDFLVTDDPSDCEVTTTETPTTTPVPGCCKGETMSASEKCNAIDDMDKCNNRAACEFIVDGTFEEDCKFDPTQPPEEPGCCYGNPDIAYSARWMESCKTFGTEAECLMLENGDGEKRCTFEPLGEYEDCETVWPTTTTTTEEVGCCYSGDSYKANDKCSRATDRDRCESMGCDFLVTEDPSDCEMTTTETPTTTEEAGCCYGEGVKENEMCGNKVGRDQCERSGKCEFRAGEDADCEFVPTTTTSEPWLGEKDEALLFGEQGSVLSEAMNTQVSLSTILVLAVLALAAQQLYKWWNAGREGYTKLAETPQQHTAYQMA